MSKKRVLLTGAGGGIGRATAKTLAEAGHQIYLVARQQSQFLEDLRLYLIGRNCYLGTRYIDFLDADWSQCVFTDAELDELRFDSLVNNAGLADRVAYSQITEDRWDRVFDINLKAAMFLSQNLIPSFIKHGGGSIVNVASVSGIKGGVFQVHYACAKAALICLSKSLSKIYIGQNVRVNAIAPGLVDTNMIDEEIALSAELGASLLDSLPMKRMATPSEIGHVIEFLISDKSSYISGQVIEVSGGQQ